MQGSSEYSSCIDPGNRILTRLRHAGATVESRTGDDEASEGLQQVTVPGRLLSCNILLAMQTSLYHFMRLLQALLVVHAGV